MQLFFITFKMPEGENNATSSGRVAAVNENNQNLNDVSRIDNAASRRERNRERARIKRQRETPEQREVRLERQRVAQKERRRKKRERESRQTFVQVGGPEDNISAIPAVATPTRMAADVSVSSLRGDCARSRAGSGPCSCGFKNKK